MAVAMMTSGRSTRRGATYDVVMRRAAILLGLAALLACAPGAHAAVGLTPIGTFSEPGYLTAPSGDAHRLFVVERTGKVWILRDGVKLSTPFLDASANELNFYGLTAIAFAPDYAQSGHVYALSVVSANDPDHPEGTRVRVDEYTRGSDPDQLDPATRRNLLDFDYADATDHQGDFLEFGPDGLLYVTIGDGLTGADRAQDPSAPRGKLLRIDPHPTTTAPYTIPAGNPFADGNGGMPEVFAYGLRNPWRFSFDQAGQLVIGDVQEAGPEEIDRLDPATGGGTNFGWPCRQGTDPKNTCTAAGAVDPILEYPHTNGRCAVIAGRLGRDPSVPALDGRFSWGDFCTGEIRSFVPASPAASDDKAAGVSAPANGINSFGEDGCAHQYVLDENGAVDRIDENAHPPCLTTSPSPLHYREGDGAVAVDPGLQLSAIDAQTIAGASVTISAGFHPREDSLSFDPQSGIAGSYDSSTGTLTLSGSAPVAAYEAALRTVRYRNRSARPSTAARTVTVDATDAAALAAPAAARGIEVEPVDTAPVVSTSSHPALYRGRPVVVDRAFAVRDADSTTLTGARVWIGRHFQQGDKLLFEGLGGVSGTYHPFRGVLELSGPAPVAEYQAALRSVRFRTTAHSPARRKGVYVTASDGQRSSPTPARHPVRLLVFGPCVNARRGTAGADTVIGGTGGDLIHTLGGDDVVRALAGDDCVSGGRGDDEIEGNRGDDRLHGRRGADLLAGGPGSDALAGDRGDDRLRGGPGRDDYHAGPGDDVVEAAGDGRDDVECGRGRDKATVDPVDRTHGCEHVTVVPAAR
jgi:hypothetical protein